MLQNTQRNRSVALRALLTAALLGAVVLTIANVIPGSSRRLEHPALGWLAVEIVLELIACLSYVWLFHRIFSRDAHTNGVLRSAQIALGELGAFAVVPTGAGGPVLRVWALMSGGMPFRVVVERSVVHGPILNLPYILAALALGIGVLLGLGPGHAPTLVALAPLGVVIVTLGLAVAATRYRGGEGSHRTNRWRALGNEALRAIPDGIRQLGPRLREPALLLAAAGFWAGDCGVLIVAVHTAHGSASIGVIVLAYMLGQLGNTLPLPGGVGGVEPLMLGVLTASHVNLGLAAAAVILYRFVSLGIQAAVGTVAVATLLPVLRRLRAPLPAPAEP